MDKKFILVGLALLLFAFAVRADRTDFSGNYFPESVGDVSGEQAALNQSNAFFDSTQAMVNNPSLSGFFDVLEVRISCFDPSHEVPVGGGGTQQDEGSLNCEGVTLNNSFDEISTDFCSTDFPFESFSRTKQTMIVQNGNETDENRYVSILMQTTKNFKTESLNFSNMQIGDVVRIPTFTRFNSDLNLWEIHDSAITFIDEYGKATGYYSWTDMIREGYSPQVIVWKEDEESVFIETILTVPVLAGDSITIDPLYNLGSLSGMTLRMNGVSANNNFGLGFSSEKGVQLLNVDNNSYANDLLIEAVYTDVNGKTDNGAVYLVKDIDKKTGSKDFNILSDFDVSWYGGESDWKLGYTSNSGSGIQLVNIDGGTYANDLMLVTITGDVNGRNESGGVFFIQNIDKLPNYSYDLNNPSSYSVGFYADTADHLGEAGRGIGVSPFELRDLDGDGKINDLVLSQPYANANGVGDCGSVFLVKNIDSLSGLIDLNVASNYAVRFDGASTDDVIGSIVWANGTGKGVQVVNTDAGAIANDLIIGTMFADVNGKTDNGAIYYIKNFDSVSGQNSLSNAANYTARWNGGETNDNFSQMDRRYDGSDGNGSIQLRDLDGDGKKNDLFTFSQRIDVNGKENCGGLYLIKNIDGLSGNYDMNFSANYTARWNGGAAGDFTDNGDFRIVNIDNNAVSNDLLLYNYQVENPVLNGDEGAVYVIRDVGSWIGNFDLNNPGSYSFSIYGSTKDDAITQQSNMGADTVQLVNSDNENFSNDLLVTAYRADVNGKSDNGAVYLFKDVNSFIGKLDANLNSYAFWGGASNSDNLGNTVYSGQGVTLFDVDADGWKDDLLITAAQADVNGKTNNGAVYLIKSILFEFGYNDLSNANNYSASFCGGENSSFLGLSSGQLKETTTGVQLTAIDSNALNDLFLIALGANVGGLNANGALYLVKNIQDLNGLYDLNNTNNFYSRWSGGSTLDTCSYFDFGFCFSYGGYFKVANLDAGMSLNDLLIVFPYADIGGISNNGAIYLKTNVADTAPVVSILHPVYKDYLSGVSELEWYVLDDSNARLATFDINYSNSIITNGQGTVILDNGILGVTPTLSCDTDNLLDNAFCVYNWDTAPITDGNYCMVISVTDRDGNLGFGADSNCFEIDNTSPTINIDVNCEGHLTITGNEKNPSFGDPRTELRLNGSGYDVFDPETYCTSNGTTFSCNYDFPGLTVGQTYTAAFYLYDLAGNASSSSTSFVPGCGSNPPSGGTEVGENPYVASRTDQLEVLPQTATVQLAPWETKTHTITVISHSQSLIQYDIRPSEEIADFVSLDTLTDYISPGQEKTYSVVIKAPNADFSTVMGKISFVVPNDKSYDSELIIIPGFEIPWLLIVVILIVFFLTRKK